MKKIMLAHFFLWIQILGYSIFAQARSYVYFEDFDAAEEISAEAGRIFESLNFGNEFDYFHTNSSVRVSYTQKLSDGGDTIYSVKIAGLIHINVGNPGEDLPSNNNNQEELNNPFVEKSLDKKSESSQPSSRQGPGSGVSLGVGAGAAGVHAATQAIFLYSQFGEKMRATKLQIEKNISSAKGYFIKTQLAKAKVKNGSLPFVSSIDNLSIVIDGIKNVKSADPQSLNPSHVKKTKWLSQDEEFIKEADLVQDTLNTIDPINEDQVKLKRFSQKALNESDYLYSIKEFIKSKEFMNMAKVTVSILLNVHPVSALSKGLAELIIGKDLITGRPLDDLGRALALVSVVTAGTSGAVQEAFKNLGKVLKSVTSSTAIAYQVSRAKDFINYARQLGIVTQKGVLNFAKLFKTVSINKPATLLDLEDIVVTAGKTKDGIPLLFEADKAVEHFAKHSESVMRTFSKNSYNLKEYMLDANHVVATGQYSNELNGYVKIIGGQGNSKAAFVGLKKSGKYISTFHIKDAKSLAVKDPSLGWSFK